MRAPHIQVTSAVCLGLWLLVALPGPALGASNAQARVRIDDTTLKVGEAAGNVTVTVRKDGGVGTVTVDFQTISVSATAGSDFVETIGSLSWADGDESDRTIGIAILDDSIAEGTESFGLLLSNAVGAETDADRELATIEIEDDDTLPDDGKAGILKFDQRSFVAPEAGGVAVITVERSKGESGAATIDYRTLDGTAVAPGDYTSAAGTLSWPSGDGGVRSFVVSLTDDSLAEGAETVRLELLSPTGGARLDPERSSAVLTITDAEDSAPDDPGDDRPGTLKLANRGGDQAIEASGVARVGVERSQGSRGAVSVELGTSDGSASAGEDYQATLTTLFWADGDQSTQFAEIAIFDDADDEGSETVGVALSNPTGGAVLDPQRSFGTMTILDDDAASSSCAVSETTLCLLQGRFQISVVWRTANGSSGRARVRALSEESGVVWFFAEDNVEMLIKTLDACSFSDSYWVFFAATTNVDFTVRVTDTVSGLTKSYSNILGRAAEPVQDVATFRGCPQ